MPTMPTMEIPQVPLEIWAYIAGYLENPFILRRVCRNEYLESHLHSCKTVDWTDISGRKLTESFIRRYADCVYWYSISKYQELSEPFIREFADDLYWVPISSWQVLSESLIRDYDNKVCWYNISCYQKLSEEFIRDYADCLDWREIPDRQYLSESIIRQYSDRIDWTFFRICKRYVNRLIEKN
jgi:hypothetical protein